MRKLPIVEIVWADANVSGGWRSREEYEKAELSVGLTVGYLLTKNRSIVTVVQSQAGSRVSDSITIPRCTIKSIMRLK